MSCRAPDSSVAQIPRSLLEVTPLPVTLALNATWPASFNVHPNKLLKLTPLPVPGAGSPVRASSSDMSVPPTQIPWLLAEVTPGPVSSARNAVCPALFSSGHELDVNESKVTPAAVPGAGLPWRATNCSVPDASDHRPCAFVSASTPSPVSQASNATRPTLLIVTGKKKSRKFTPLGVPGAVAPLRATSARLPGLPDQIPLSFEGSTPLPARYAA